MGTNKDKGDILEELVALLHELPGVVVERKAKVPALGEGGGTREIDVLVKGKLAGYPFCVPIECKNWAERVGVEVVDAFAGKLKQVDLPAASGVLVSASGYTSDAVAAAKHAGIRLLEFEGLTADRLDLAVGQAFRTTVYVTLDWVSMSHLAICPSDSAAGPELIDVCCARLDTEPLELWGLRAVWESWREGKLDLTIGERAAFVHGELPGEVLIVDLRTYGHVFTEMGEARFSSLRNTANQKIEKARIEAGFPLTSGEPTQAIGLKSLASEDELEEHTRAGSLHIVLGRVRVPRIASRGGWYPPSKRALTRFRELQQAGEEITFLKVEGSSDIRIAWEEPVNPRDFSRR